jgi:hypothetical protein
MSGAADVPAAGDLIWTDFDPGRGREQAGRRPALVLYRQHRRGGGLPDHVLDSAVSDQRCVARRPADRR